MRHFIDWYQQLISRLDALVEEEPKREKNISSAQKYIFASVFPDQETMNIALDSIKNPEK